MRVYDVDVAVAEISFFLRPVTLFFVALNDAMLLHVVER